jgi:hypothetical protein
VDPLTQKYPELTPYQFASDRPIDGIDLDGLEYTPASSKSGNPRDATAVQVGINPEAVVKRMADKNKKQQAPIVINSQSNATLSQGPTPGTWSANESERLKKQYNFNKEMAARSDLDPYSFGVANSMASAGTSLVATIYNHGFGLAEGIEEKNGWKIAGNTVLLALDFSPFFRLGGASVSFYSVQSEESVARLMAGGEPWPTAPTSAHLGEGLYAWGTRAEAEAYLNALSQRMPGVNLKIMEFNINMSQLKNLNGFKVPAEDAAANKWLETHSSLFGSGTPHGFNYIQRTTSMGVEHYFSKQAFQLFKIKTVR